MTRKLILILGVIIALIVGINWTKRFFQIDSCLDLGGRWNYELNECKEYYDINEENITDFYWNTDYDSIRNKETLIKGKLIDSLRKSPTELIEILNKRNLKPKIEYIDISFNTIQVRIINDEYLSERMGTSGAYCYLGEAVFTLTEIELIKFVRIEMNAGSHASPGIYSRNDYKDLVK